MGRSLGSMPAIDLALHHQNEINGLIIESGSANNFRRPLSRLGAYFYHPVWEERQGFLSKVKIRSIHIPTLIIHAQYDRYVSLQEGKELYENSGAKDKSMLIIPEANHFNLVELGMEQCLRTIGEFIRTHSE